MTKPITPFEADLLKVKSLPDAVYETFNELIVKYWDTKSAKFGLVEVKELLMKKMDTSEEEIEENKWLEIQDVYGTEGWIVTYDIPKYLISHQGYFLFRRK